MSAGWDGTHFTRTSHGTNAAEAFRTWTGALPIMEFFQSSRTSHSHTLHTFLERPDQPFRAYGALSTDGGLLLRRFNLHLHVVRIKPGTSASDLSTLQILPFSSEGTSNRYSFVSAAQSVTADRTISPTTGAQSKPLQTNLKHFSTMSVFRLVLKAMIAPANLGTLHAQPLATVRRPGRLLQRLGARVLNRAPSLARPKSVPNQADVRCAGTRRFGALASHASDAGRRVYASWSPSPTHTSTDELTPSKVKALILRVFLGNHITKPSATQLHIMSAVTGRSTTSVSG